MVAAPAEIKEGFWVIKKGASWSTVLTYYNSDDTLVNLAGKTARMVFKPSFGSDTEILELTSSSGITLGGAAGTITLALTTTQTALFKCKTAVFDLQLITGSVVDTIATGEVTISEGV